jgi:hypothetical protein
MRVFDDLKRDMKQAASKAKAGRGGARLNVAVKRNIKVAANVGKPGSVNVASAEQNAPIDQRP